MPTLDPAFLDLFDRQKALASGDLLEGDLLEVDVDELRATARLQVALGNGLPPADSPRDIELSGDTGVIAGRVYRSREAREDAELPVLVWYPGGGFVFGHLDDSDSVCQFLADQADCLVVSVAYRLAPEHPWPAAHEDAIQALAAIRRGATSWGGRPDELAVGGDSAGGHLAAYTARSALESGQPLSMQLLYYPIVDAAMSTPSYDDFADGYGLRARDMEWFFDCYRVLSEPGASEFSHVRSSTAAFVVTAECDVLRDEAEALVGELTADGTSAIGLRFLGVPHGFIHMTSATEHGRMALSAGATALRTAWNGTA